MQVLEKLHGSNLWGLESTPFVDAPSQIHDVPSDLWKQQLDAFYIWCMFLRLIIGSYV